jgi:hypothetical protein
MEYLEQMSGISGKNEFWGEKILKLAISICNS